MQTDDFAERIAMETDPDLLWGLAAAWLDGMGFDRVLHLAIDRAGGVAARTTLGRAFEAHYQDRQLARHDPFLTYCLPARQPVATGADYLGDYAYLTAPERDVILAASETGFRAGFSCVTRADPGGQEAWNVGSTLPRAEIEAIRRARGSEIRLGLMALRGRLAGPAAGGLVGLLSPRERACLDLLGEGLRTKAIAAELGVSPVTVELHLRNARGKLGAATRDQALLLYRASRASGDGAEAGRA